MTKAKYYTDNANKRVICVISIPNTDWRSLHGTFKGVAKCSPSDTFDENVGKELAYTRALLKLKKAEVEFHKREMNYYESEYRKYVKHKNSYDYNLQRVKEVRQELVDIIADTNL